MAKKPPTKKTRPAARAKKKPAKRPRPAAKAAKPARRKATVPKPARPRTAPAAPAPNPVRALAQRIVDLTVRHDDVSSFVLYADTVESIEPGQPPFVGIEAIKQKFAGWRAMTTESTWQARNVLVDGNTIAIEWEGHVKFATGKEADLKEVAIHEVENGKIVRERFYYDRSALQP